MYIHVRVSRLGSAARRITLLLAGCVACAVLVSGCSSAASTGSQPAASPTHTASAVRHTIAEFPLPTITMAPQAVAVGPDGNVWFTEVSTSAPSGQIGRMTPEGSFTAYPLPTPNTYPTDIVSGPDGNLWFSEPGAVGRINVNGTITEYRLPSAAAILSLTVGPDHALWFGEFGAGDPTRSAGKVGRITVNGAISEFALPTAGFSPIAITAGSDGAIWFSEVNFVSGAGGGGPTGLIGRITTSGTLSTFPLPAGAGLVRHIASGADGFLWFTEDANNPNDKQASGKIGRMSLSGAVTEFPLPSGNGPVNCVTPAPDGTVIWVCGQGLGHMTLAGVLTSTALPTAGNAVAAIAVGSQGTVWFTEESASGPGPNGANGKIGRFG